MEDGPWISWKCGSRWGTSPRAWPSCSSSCRCGRSVSRLSAIFTYTQARNQSKLFAPQVAKHLREGRLKDAIALSSSKNYRYSHLAKVVLAGLQEYQFQQESGGGLSREDLMDTVRRAIQRASALTASDLKKGVSALATIGSTAPFVGLLGTVVGVINAFQGIATSGSARHRRRVGRYFGSARRDRARSGRRDSGGLVLQLPDRRASSTSTWRWTTPRRSSSTTSSGRRRKLRNQGTRG